MSLKSEHTDEAWDFVMYATDASRVESYLEKAVRPTALKSLINSQIENEDLHATAVQTLTASYWYKGKDPLAAEDALKDMAEDLLEAASEKEIKNILETTVQKINQTIQ